MDPGCSAGVWYLCFNDLGQVAELLNASEFPLFCLTALVGGLYEPL